VPACVCDKPHTAISVGITTAYSWTSMASSAHPVKHAENVRRSRTFMLVNQFATIPLSSAGGYRVTAPAARRVVPGEPTMLHLTGGEP
jgi:hypothetical protein